AGARWLTEQWYNLGLPGAHVLDADRAAELAKCDLVTEMVREFTELQGVVGGLYARAQGEADEVADAVYDHYRPVGWGDPSVCDRRRVVFRGREGYAYDEVSAVFRAGADDVVDARKRLAALKAIRKSKNFEPLTVSFKRIRKIVEKANLGDRESVVVNASLFEGDA